MDSSSTSRASVLGFGIFELDRRAGELRKSGVLVHLPPQPFNVLSLLASHSGQIVTREDIHQQIWGDETYVDFEQGLNHCIRQIRTALGDNADAPRYIETLPRRGYRFIGPVKIKTGSKERRPNLVRIIVFCCAVIVPVLGTLLALNVARLRTRLFGRATSPPKIQSIAVLPLENLSHDPEQEYFAEGMTDELITELSKIGALRVISRTSVMRYKGTRKPLPEIARELNVGAVIDGSVQRSGDRVRINAELVDASTLRILWAQKYDRDLGDILALHSDVALAIVRQIRITLTPEEQRLLASARPVNPRAYEASLRGWYLWNKRTGEDMRKGINYFEQAVKIDPNYASAYAGLADSYVLLPFYGPSPSAIAYQKAKAAAQKAVTLDESLAEGYTSLADVSFRYDWNWSGAEKEFRRAIAINPGYATAHHWYAEFLSLTGRHDEALAEMKRAQRLDPLSLVINTDLGMVLLFRGEYDLAIKQLLSTRELYPTSWYVRFWLGTGYLEKGLHEDGLMELELAVKLSEGNPSALSKLAYGYATAGETGNVRRTLFGLRQRAKESYVSPYQFAVVYAALGEKDRAFEYLEKAFQARNIQMAGINSWVVVRSLRPDPRFQDLLRRMNFPKESAAAD